MLYSIVPASMLLISVILNWESVRNNGFFAKDPDKQKLAFIRYNWFLLTANCYFIVDMMWGVLYEYRDIPGIFPFIYSFTVFYFIFMLLTMLTWTRFIVAYLDKSGHRSSKLLLYGVWVMVSIGIICLMLNHFYQFMFSFNDAHEYIGEVGRNVSFILQIVFYVVITLYMLHVANRTAGRQRFRYHAVAVTSIVLGLFLVFQIIYAFLPSYSVGLMLGICLVHSFVQSGEKKEKEIHDNISAAMAEDYEVIFYIEIATGEYLTFAESQKYSSLNANATGRDFFREAIESIDDCVYPDDQEYAKSFYDKESMLKNLESRRSFSFKYRVMVDGKPRFFLFTVMRESNDQFLIFYEKDIEDELMAEKQQKENQKKTITFGQIAESLASNYDDIYYVNIDDSSYVSYQVNNIYGQLEINDSGKDFFSEAIDKLPRIVYGQDCEQVTDFLDKDSMISAMESRKRRSMDYRIMVSGRLEYVRMTVRKSSDGTHFIIGIENVDKEIRKEKQHLRELKAEKALARRDELTGVKNKTAYKELEESVQENMDRGMDYLSFALVVCDTNNLKQINDTLGHTAGDEYIKETSQVLCDIFVHSPVFRVGGDEFAVFLRGNDYEARYELMEKLRGQMLANKREGKGVILAAGMAEYNPETDSFVSDIFERADKEMYEDKQRLKGEIL